MRFIIAQGHGQRIFRFQGDGGVVSGADRADRAAFGVPRDAVCGRRAERDIRMAKVRQKVSGCFRTLRHAEAHCRISSYLQSMAHQSYNPLTAIHIALNGTAATMIEQEKGASSY